MACKTAQGDLHSPTIDVSMDQLAKNPCFLQPRVEKNSLFLAKMASLKVKFRPSSVKDREETLFYQIIHLRQIRQIYPELHIKSTEWDGSNIQWFGKIKGRAVRSKRPTEPTDDLFSELFWDAEIFRKSK